VPANNSPVGALTSQPKPDFWAQYAVDNADLAAYIADYLEARRRG
jgi:hypothetical protein